MYYYLRIYELWIMSSEFIYNNNFILIIMNYELRFMKLENWKIQCEIWSFKY